MDEEEGRARIVGYGGQLRTSAAGAAREPRLKLRGAVHGLRAAVKQVGVAGNPEQVDKTLEILTEARRRIYTLLAEGD